MKKISYRCDWIVFIVVPLRLTYMAVQPNMYRDMVHWWEWSLNLLYLILFMKPILVIIGHRIQYTLLHFRRQLGVLSFWFALFHTAGIIWLRGWRHIDMYLWYSNYLFWWMVAMIGMVLLALTSNYRSIKTMKYRRKKLQYLAYPVLFMTLLHEALIPRDLRRHGYAQQLWPVITLFGVFFLLKTVEYLITTKKIPSLWSYFTQIMHRQLAAKKWNANRPINGM